MIVIFIVILLDGLLWFRKHIRVEDKKGIKISRGILLLFQLKF